MAKLPKLVLRPCQEGSKEWIQLLKFVLAATSYGLKLQYSILKNADKGAILPTLEFFKEKVYFFEPNAALRFILSNSIPLNNVEDSITLSIAEWEESLLLPLVSDSLNSDTPQKAFSLVQDKLSLLPKIKREFIELSLFADLYLLSANYPKDFELFPSLKSWFLNFESSEVVESSLKLVKDLSSGVLPASSTEESQVKQSIIGDESMRKIKNSCILPPKSTEPKLPIEGQENILITSALPYVNNVPHLGNLIGSTLSADVFARYCRVSNINYIYICGTDEYGTATETKALEEGVTCQELCDKYNALHKQVYEWFEFDFDYFGRTTTPKQTEIAQDIFQKLLKNDFLFQDTMTQLYCEKCCRFLADRYVEGICPKCNYNDARGDQCDQCGGLLNASDLIKPRCKMDGNSPILRDSTHMFLNLPKLQSECEAFVEKNSELGKWTANGRTITHSWLKEGLKPRCITRDLKWGTPVPLESMKDKVFYVWYDAPIGYPSITANYTPEWEKWWKNPENVKLYQFMGKDNVPFHTVIFPSCLIGTREPWTLLHHINTTEYLNYEDGKFSKSRNVGVFGNNVMDTGIPVSVWRYYLVSCRPDTNDSIFTWSEFIAKNNNELLANFGNFCNRILKFLASHRYNSTLSEFLISGEPEQNLIRDVNAILTRYHGEMKLGKIRQGLRLVMEISQLGNGYLQSVKIDNTLFTQHRDLCDAAVGTAVNLVYLLAGLIFPFMPSTASKLCAQLNAPLPLIETSFDAHTLLPGHVIGLPQHLFTRIDEKMEHIYRAQYSGNSN